jgi:mannosyl-3-phosphoglycerate phosphatase
MKRRVLIFTDLDGALLDYHTYSFRKALPALRLIRKKGIPLIICTSKTRSEIEIYQKKIKNHHPFISENGGAIFIPRDYFKRIPSHLREVNGYLIKELGTPYRILRRKLLEIAGKYGQKIRGFGDMNAEEIRKYCGLSAKEASLSKKREYDEAFYFMAPPRESILGSMQREFLKAGLKIVKGGRLYHLTGQNDKGTSARLLTRMYEKEWERKVVSIGIGDSFNDLPLLAEVDLPVVVKLHTGRYEAGLSRQLENPFLARGIGPEGWNEAVLRIIEKLEG